MAMIIGAELSFVAGIGGMILQLALLFIVFSLPGRFKEQRTNVWMRSRSSSICSWRKRKVWTDLLAGK